MSPETQKITEEDFQRLLEHSYYIVSEAYQKMRFFKGHDLKASSTLILMDLIKNWGHPCTKSTLNGAKKAKEANNLLLLPVDSSWNQKILVWEGAKFKSFQEWGAHATHVSDLLVFRPSFFSKYDYSNLTDSCYDIEEDILRRDYWWLVK